MSLWSLRNLINNRKVVITGKGEVVAKDFNAKEMLGTSALYRKMDPFTRYAVAAAKLALQSANLAPPEETGVVMATLWGPISTLNEFLLGMAENGLNLASAFLFPNVVINMAAGMISIEFKLKGPSATIVGEAEPALRYAADLIENGKAPVMLAGYVDEENEISKVPLVGSVVYVLESAEHAKRKGANKLLLI